MVRDLIKVNLERETQGSSANVSPFPRNDYLIKHREYRKNSVREWS